MADLELLGAVADNVTAGEILSVLKRKNKWYMASLKLASHWLIIGSFLLIVVQCKLALYDIKAKFH